MDDVDLFVGEPIVSWMLLCLSPLMPAVVSVLGAEGRDLGMNRGNVLQVHLPNFEGLVGSLQVLVYSLLCYASFQTVVVWLVLFLANLWLPRSVDQGPEMSLPAALAVDLGLIALFGLQHSVMARASFKERLTAFVHPAAERSSYVLATNLALAALFVFWIPVQGTLWQLTSTWAVTLAWGIFEAGWVVLLVATFTIDHFELFGLRQAWDLWRDNPPRRSEFQIRGIYRVVRHPIQLGVLLGVWATPTMTFGHFVFAAGMTLYIFIGLWFEERDLIRQFGQDYLDYRDAVAKVLPGVRVRRK